MNKQIEEMAKVLCGISKECKKCRLTGLCLAYNSADLIYNAGYRKQREGAWIWEHGFYGKMLCSVCKEEALANECNEYVDSDFCPNCGAKMKG